MATPGYARLRPATPGYARLRPATPGYARLRPATPGYARLRPCFVFCAKLPFVGYDLKYNIYFRLVQMVCEAATHTEILTLRSRITPPYSYSYYS